MGNTRRGLGPGPVAFISVLSGSAAAAGINIATGDPAWAAITGALLLVLLYATLEGWRAKRSPSVEQKPQPGLPFSSVHIPGFVPQPPKRSNRPMVAALAGYAVYLVVLALVLIAATHGNTSSGSGRAQVAVAADLAGAWSGLAHNVDETDSWAIRLVLPQGRHSGSFEYARRHLGRKHHDADAEPRHVGCGRHHRLVGLRALRRDEHRPDFGGSRQDRAAHLLLPL